MIIPLPPPAGDELPMFVVVTDQKVQGAQTAGLMRSVLRYCSGAQLCGRHNPALPRCSYAHRRIRRRVHLHEVVKRTRRVVVMVAITAPLVRYRESLVCRLSCTVASTARWPGRPLCPGLFGMRIVATSGDLLAVIRGSSTRAVASSNRRLCGLGLHAAAASITSSPMQPVVRCGPGSSRGPLVSNHLLTPCPRT
jgi:hypothetical protein